MELSLCSEKQLHLEYAIANAAYFKARRQLNSGEIPLETFNAVKAYLHEVIDEIKKRTDKEMH